jgi:DNA-binding transcriptional MerR regulator
MDTVSIGKAAEMTGLSAKTIRFYEEINLLAPAKRQENSYRTYSKEDLEILLLIKEAKSLGLSLKDVKEVVHLCVSKGCESANIYLKNKVPLYLNEIELKINELKNLQTKLMSYQQKANDSNNGSCLICLKDC